MACGTVYTYTVIHTAPTNIQQSAPYACVLVEMDNGEHMVARFAGDLEPEGLFIGRRLNVSEEERVVFD